MVKVLVTRGVFENLFYAMFKGSKLNFTDEGKMQLMELGHDFNDKWVVYHLERNAMVCIFNPSTNKLIRDFHPKFIKTLLS